MRIGSLCSGAGMLDLAADALLGGRLAWVAETDADASTVLAARFPEAVNLGDISTVDWRSVEPVDILTAGYPCQDLSNAGKRAGIEGARSGVWRHVADAVRVLRPRLVLLENVASHLARGFGRVLGDLAAVGYDASWTCLRASDVGAPHQRDRVFIWAVPANSDGERLRIEPVALGARSGTSVAGGDRPADGLSLLPTPRASDADKGGPGARGSRGDLRLPAAVALLLPTPTATDAKAGRNATAARRSTGHHEGWTLSDVAYADRWLQYGPAIRRWEAVLGRPAPTPTVVGKRGGQRLSGRFVEWMMGLPDGWVSELVDNNAAVRICGNGVVPLQAIAAYRQLALAWAVAA